MSALPSFTAEAYAPQESEAADSDDPAFAPGSPEARALEVAREGRDHHEEAFAALLDMIRRDGAALAGAANAMLPPEEMLRQSPLLRGRRFLVRGTLLQRSRLPRPWAHVEEWFLRHEDGTPFILFVAEHDPEALLMPVTAGAPVQAPARFYKRIDEVAQDGVLRSYAVFVTDAQFVRPVRVADPALRRTGPLLAIIVALLPMLLVIRLLMRRVAVRRAAAASAAEENELEGAEDLPDDPIDALHELRRRAEPGTEWESRSDEHDR